MIEIKRTYMIERFLSQTEFSSQEDFIRNFRINVPENFNFGYDIVDAWAAESPDKKALLWTNDKGECLGFVPGEYREHILSRIEAHRMTHTTVEAVEMAAGNQTVSIKIIC